MDMVNIAGRLANAQEKSSWWRNPSTYYLWFCTNLTLVADVIFYLQMWRIHRELQCNRQKRKSVVSLAIDTDPQTSPSSGQVTSARLILIILQKMCSLFTLICGEK